MSITHCLLWSSMWRVTRLSVAALASVLTVVPQHEVWGGQSLLRELSRLTAVWVSMISCKSG